MTTVFSLEPIENQYRAELEREICSQICVLSRTLFLSEKQIHDKIEVLICRDRDNISEILDLCPKLRFLFILSAGVEKLPFRKLFDKQVLVANCGGVNAGIISEYVMANILSHSTRLLENLYNQKIHEWKKYQCVDTLAGKNLLIVGAGHIGKKVAEKAKAFQMNCIGVRNSPISLPNFDSIINLEMMRDYLGWADYIVVTLPLTTKTNQLFDYSMFSNMKESAVFLNISRGQIVVERDLVRALNENKIHAAVLDVFEQEPISKESNLWDIPNLIITPHSSGRMENYIHYAFDTFVSNYNLWKNGLPILNRVDLLKEY